MSKFVAWFNYLKKSVAFAAGVVAQVVAAGVLSGSALHWAQAFLVAATGYGIWKADNGPKPGILGKALVDPAAATPPVA